MNQRAVRDDITDIGPAVAWAGELVSGAGLSPDVLFAVEICIEEALANLIMHGRSLGADKDIGLAVAADSAGATVTITDRCAPFDAVHETLTPTQAAATEGGRGLGLIRSFAAGMGYDSEAGRNSLTMRFSA